jgi:ABC-type Fe3+ transport system substrate-binding protein
MKRLKEEVAVWRHSVGENRQADQIIGSSPSMQEVYKTGYFRQKSMNGLAAWKP